MKNQRLIVIIGTMSLGKENGASNIPLKYQLARMREWDTGSLISAIRAATPEPVPTLSLSSHGLGILFAPIRYVLGK